MVDDVEACLSRTHPGCTGTVPIGKSLTAVIVLLFVDVQGCECDVDVSSLVDVQMVGAGGGGKAEVFSNDH